jgi:hypothetical protein
MVAVCWVAASALLLAVTVSAAAAAESELPLTVDGAILVENNVRVGGASKKGASISLYRGASCSGAPLATAAAEEAGRFTVSADGFDPPFTVSVRATVGKRQSACVPVTVK